MEKLSSILNRPEYVHAAINHFPLAGLFVAMLALVIALPTKNQTAIRIGLALVALLSLSVWPVYHFGEEGYDRVLSMADEPGAQFLEHHKDLGERWVFLFFITAGVAALGFSFSWKWPRSLPWSSLLALVLAASSLVAGIAIAQIGGQVRHREFRFGPPPAHHHQE
jgi:predicted benzoate:H+ symporter BenE